MPVITFDPTRPQFADVSHYQPVIDFATYAAATGAAALAFEVTEGSYLDPTANAHLAGAKAAGLLCIGYEYGLVNVNTFLGLFPPKAGRIPVLDFEGASLSVAGAEAWIRAVKAAYGRYPWFYGHNEWITQGSPANTEVSNCPYWGARYGGPLEIPAGVGKPVAFQFTDGSNGPHGRTVSPAWREDFLTSTCWSSSRPSCGRSPVGSRRPHPGPRPSPRRDPATGPKLATHERTGASRPGRRCACTTRSDATVTGTADGQPFGLRTRERRDPRGYFRPRLISASTASWAPRPGRPPGRPPRNERQGSVQRERQRGDRGELGVTPRKPGAAG